MCDSFDIVVFLGGTDWESYHRRQMILALARTMRPAGRVLAVERPVCPATTPFLHRDKFSDWLRGRRNFRAVSPNLFVCTPVVLLHDQIAAKFRVVEALNRRILSFQLRRAMARAGFKARVLVAWYYSPWQFPHRGVAGERCYVYERLDDYSQFAAGLYSRIRLQQMDRQMAEGAAVVFATARSLCAEMKKMNPNTHYVPNGVNFELFRNAARRRDAVPDDLKRIGRPRIGFVGN
ncbi:MAG: hypothetical protein V2A71_08255, partial [Candidatus Eisenbacteria bacterium]